MSLSESQKIVYLLAKTSGIGNIKGRKLLEQADTTSLNMFLYSIHGSCPSKDYAELEATADKLDFDGFADGLADKNIELISYLDKIKYPDSLSPYNDMPLIIYAKGDTSLLNRPSFAVVGTRYPTNYGIRATREFAAKLSEKFCIVSGMARGVDAYAHRAAMEAGGKTVAVLGSGVDVVYPSENYSLYRDIVTNGLVISEYEPGTNASAHNFPARNRIISGLAKSVLVTEAGLKSGTMLTISSAQKQGKDIFCVPGSIYSAKSSGCNRCIAECQSRAVLDVNDIYDELGISKVEITKPSALQLDFNEDAVLKILTQNGEMHFEEILDNIDLSVPQLSSLMVKMETVGLVNKTKPNYWSV